MTQPSITIEVTDEIIDRAVQGALRTRHWDDDTGQYEETTVSIKDLVRDQLKQDVAREIGVEARELASGMLEIEVRKILADGFPAHNSYGERTGTTTIAQIVGKTLFKGDRYSDDLTRSIRKVMDAEIKAQVKSAVAAISEDMRASMKEAAAVALADWMRKTAGIGR